jgi:hypothetical protein
LGEESGGNNCAATDARGDEPRGLGGIGGRTTPLALTAGTLRNPLADGGDGVGALANGIGTALAIGNDGTYVAATGWPDETRVNIIGVVLGRLSPIIMMI